MNFDLSSLKKDEQLALQLREVFEVYGYSQYTMSKFEEYRFYLENKNFLKTGQIIAFTDGSGRLLALKPDITLSIAKTTRATKEKKDKLYYNETVYRYAKRSKESREVRQMGLEVMGDVDVYQTYEVILLALKSLENISTDFVLDISHIGLLNGLFDGLGIEGEEIRQKISDCIVEKNTHDMAKYGLSEDKAQKLQKALNLPADFGKALEVLKKLSSNDILQNAIKELADLWAILKIGDYGAKVNLDISIVNDTNYYNGIIFQGFVKTVPFMVLSGGRYDLLMQKFGKDINAIGFALTLDELARYFPMKRTKEKRVAVVYDDNTNTSFLAQIVASEQKNGYCVSAVKNNVDPMLYGRVLTIKSNNVVEVKNV